MKRNHFPYWLAMPVFLFVYWLWTGIPAAIASEMIQPWWPVLLLVESLIIMITPALNQFQDALQ